LEETRLKTRHECDILERENQPLTEMPPLCSSSSSSSSLCKPVLRMPLVTPFESGN